MKTTTFFQKTATYINPGWLKTKAQNLVDALDDSNIPKKDGYGIAGDTKECQHSKNRN